MKRSIVQFNPVEVSSDGRTMTVTVPLQLATRGGRKIVLTPDHAPPWVPRISMIDDRLVNALARGYRWQCMLEKGEYSSTEAIAAKEGVSRSFVSRLLRLLLLAPDIIESVLDGRHPGSLQAEVLKGALPLSWDQQRDKFTG